MTRMLLLSTLWFAVLAGAAATQAQTFGDWYVETRPTGGGPVYASVLNDSGNAFGQFCFPSGSCIWLLGLVTACKSGDKYPVLANADTGSLPLEVYCDGQLQSGLYRYAFTNFDQIETMVKGSLRVGFALPLQQDQFRVVRFNLRGSEAALSTMLLAAQKFVKPTKRGTRDEKM